MHDGGMAHVEVLTGQRVTLRAPALDDAEELFERRVRPRSARATCPGRRIRTSTRRGGSSPSCSTSAVRRTWLIELRDSGEIVGAMRLAAAARPQQWTSAIAWAVSGGVRESCRRWSSSLLDEMESDPGHIPRSRRYCHVDNTRSARVLQRAGLVVRGPAGAHTVLPNISTEPQDCLLFAKAVR